MLKISLLLTFTLYISISSFGQDSTTNLSELKSNFLKDYPEKLKRIKCKPNDGSELEFGIDKKNRNLYLARYFNPQKDSCFLFCFVGSDILFCALIVGHKRSAKIYQFYKNSGSYIPFGKETLQIDKEILDQKGKSLYQLYYSMKDEGLLK